MVLGKFCRDNPLFCNRKNGLGDDSPDDHPGTGANCIFIHYISKCWGQEIEYFKHKNKSWTRSTFHELYMNLNDI